MFRFSMNVQGFAVMVCVHGRVGSRTVYSNRDISATHWYLRTADYCSMSVPPLMAYLMYSCYHKHIYELLLDVSDFK